MTETTSDPIGSLVFALMIVGVAIGLFAVITFFVKKKKRVTDDTGLGYLSSAKPTIYDEYHQNEKEYRLPEFDGADPRNGPASPNR